MYIQTKNEENKRCSKYMYYNVQYLKQKKNESFFSFWLLKNENGLSSELDLIGNDIHRHSQDPASEFKHFLGFGFFVGWCWNPTIFFLFYFNNFAFFLFDLINDKIKIVIYIYIDFSCRLTHPFKWDFLQIIFFR